MSQRADTTANESDAGGCTSQQPIPRVLCIVDRPGWAHDRKTDALAETLAGRYRIVKRFQQEVTDEELESADIVLLYYWLQFERLGAMAATLRRRKDRLVVGVCGEIELEGAWREPGLATLTELPRAVFANNLTLVGKLEPLLGRKVFYTPNGVDTRFFVPPATRRVSDALRVGWAGSLGNHGLHHRGVHEFLAPAIQLVPGSELCLAAREDHWRGPSEMRDFYHSLDIYVCASKSEGTPNPCLEAAASGLPVLTTRVGNMPELICHGKNGFFIERDIADIAAKLITLRDDTDLRSRMGHCARSMVEPWDWRNQATNFDALFRSVLGDESTQPA